MRDPYIQSITISFPSCFVNGERSYLSSLFKNNKWGNYFKYGNFSYILIDSKIFTQSNNILSKITPFLHYLQRSGIISPEFTLDNAKIHEIKLRFDIDIPGCVFCGTGYFLKVDNITYRSNDTRQKIRKNKDPNKNDWSKGRQQSFLTVKQYNKKGSSVILTFSGKYAKQIPTSYLYLDNNDLIDKLCSLGSVYLTQATNPQGFKIARGYVSLLHGRFHQMLKDANWFKDNFKQRRITSL